MSDLVAMKAKTIFHDDRVRNDKGGLVEEGDTFETDVTHAKDLHRLGHADPVSGTLDGIEAGPLSAHHQVSQRALDEDRAKRAPGSGADLGTDAPSAPASPPKKAAGAPARA